VPARLPPEQVRVLAAAVEADPAASRVTVDLVARTVAAPGAGPFGFEIDDEPREMLLEGLDAIDLTLKHRPAIEAFLARDRRDRPWIYLAAPGPRLD
jgi:3-isopropylmalate/(R)-2-methylmalate dehydratase small subunit